MYLPSGVQALSFVQLGAHCGKNTYNCAQGGDPLWSYVTMCGWRGVAVEPSTPAFKALCRNYARWPRVRPLRAAASNSSQGGGVLMRGGGEMNQLVFSGSHPYLHARARQLNESVPVLSLLEIWRLDAVVKPVDVLVLDVEGAEARILANGGGGLPALPTSELPRMVLFEHQHMGRPDRRRVHEALGARGYRWVADLLYVDHRNQSRCRCPDNRHLKTCQCWNNPANRLYGLPSRENGVQPAGPPLVVSIRSGISYPATEL